MSVIIRLQGLPWTATAMDIRQFFKGLNIPAGGVHIIGGEKGDAFIAFGSDEDARRAMMLNMQLIRDAPTTLLLSSKTEMQTVIAEAKGQVSTPAAAEPTPNWGFVPQQQQKIYEQHSAPPYAPVNEPGKSQLLSQGQEFEYQSGWYSGEQEAGKQDYRGPGIDYKSPSRGGQEIQRQQALRGPDSSHMHPPHGEQEPDNRVSEMDPQAMPRGQSFRRNQPSLGGVDYDRSKGPREVTDIEGHEAHRGVPAFDRQMTPRRGLDHDRSPGPRGGHDFDRSHGIIRPEFERLQGPPRGGPEPDRSQGSRVGPEYDRLHGLRGKPEFDRNQPPRHGPDQKTTFDAGRSAFDRSQRPPEGPGSVADRPNEQKGPGFDRHESPRHTGGPEMEVHQQGPPGGQDRHPPQQEEFGRPPGQGRPDNRFGGPPGDRTIEQIHEGLPVGVEQRFRGPHLNVDDRKRPPHIPESENFPPRPMRLGHDRAPPPDIHGGPGNRPPPDIHGGPGTRPEQRFGKPPEGRQPPQNFGHPDKDSFDFGPHSTFIDPGPCHEGAPNVPGQRRAPPGRGPPPPKMDIEMRGTQLHMDVEMSGPPNIMDLEIGRIMPRMDIEMGPPGHMDMEMGGPPHVESEMRGPPPPGANAIRPPPQPVTSIQSFPPAETRRHISGPPFGKPEYLSPGDRRNMDPDFRPETRRGPPEMSQGRIRDERPGSGLDANQSRPRDGRTGPIQGLGPRGPPPHTDDIDIRRQGDHSLRGSRFGERDQSRPDENADIDNRTRDFRGSPHDRDSRGRSLGPRDRDRDRERYRDHDRDHERPRDRDRERDRDNRLNDTDRRRRDDSSERSRGVGRFSDPDRGFQRQDPGRGRFNDRIERGDRDRSQWDRDTRVPPPDERERPRRDDRPPLNSRGPPMIERSGEQFQDQSPRMGGPPKGQGLLGDAPPGMAPIHTRERDMTDEYEQPPFEHDSPEHHNRGPPGQMLHQHQGQYNEGGWEELPEHAGMGPPRRLGQPHDPRFEESNEFETEQFFPEERFSHGDVRGHKRPYPPEECDLCIIITNMPPITSYRDLRRFFMGGEIPRDGLKLLVDDRGRRIGVAFVKFATEHGYYSALEKNGHYLNGGYADIQPTSREEFDKAVDGSPPTVNEASDHQKRPRIEDQPSSYSAPREKIPWIVQLKGLSQSVSIVDLRNFFGGLKIADNGGAVFIDYDSHGRSTGCAFVEFGTVEDYKTALGYDGRRMGSRPIKIFVGTKKQVDELISRQQQTSKKESSGSTTPAGPKSEMVSKPQLEQCTPNTGASLQKPSQTTPNSSDKSPPKTNGSGSTVPDKSITRLGTPQSRKTTTSEPETQRKQENPGETSLDKQGDKVSRKTDNSPTSTDADIKPGMSGDGIVTKTPYYCVQLQGLPPLTNVKDVRDLFQGMEIVPRGIQILFDAGGRAMGDAFIEFVTKLDCEKAMQKNKHTLGNRTVTVKPIAKADMLEMVKRSKQPGGRQVGPPVGRRTGFYVKAQNLPYSTSIGEILNFFRGYNPVPDTVRVQFGSEGKPGGTTAVVGFRTKDDAERSIRELHNKFCRSNPVSLSPAMI